MPRLKGMIFSSLSSNFEAKGKGTRVGLFERYWLIVGDSFGWTNASYLYGLSLMSVHAKRALGVNADYEAFAKAKSKATQM